MAFNNVLDRRIHKANKKLSKLKIDTEKREDIATCASTEIQQSYIDDLHKFWREIIGATHTPNLINDGSHKEWCEVFSQLSPDNPRSVLFLEPRFSLKTSFMTAFALWWGIKYPNSNIFYIRKSFDKAVEWLYELRMILKQNPKFKKIFGSHTMWIGEPDSRQALNFSDIEKPFGTRTAISRDPLFRIYGMESAITGTHCNRGIVIWDDGADENDVYSRAEFDATMRFFTNLPPIIQDSSFVVVGTRWGREIYGHIIDNVNSELREEGLKEYVVLQGTPLDPSYEEQNGLVKNLKDLPDDNNFYRFLSVTKNILKKMYIDMGHRKWYANFFQRVLPDEERIFSTLPTTYSLYDINLDEFKYIVAAIDPASGKTAGDYTGIAVIGLHNDNNYYILGAFASRRAMSHQPKNMAKIIKRYYPKIKAFILESNSIDVSLAKITIPKLIIEELNEMERIDKDLKGNTKVDKVWTKKDIEAIVKYKRTQLIKKEARISAMEPAVTLGFLRFPREDQVREDEGFRELYSELKGFTAKGAEDKDDVLDALQIAYEFTRFNYGRKNGLGI